MVSLLNICVVTVASLSCAGLLVASELAQTTAEPHKVSPVRVLIGFFWIIWETIILLLVVTQFVLWGCKLGLKILVLANGWAMVRAHFKETASDPETGCVQTDPARPGQAACGQQPAPATLSALGTGHRTPGTGVGATLPSNNQATAFSAAFLTHWAPPPPEASTYSTVIDIAEDNTIAETETEECPATINNYEEIDELGIEGIKPRQTERQALTGWPLWVFG